MRYDLTSPKLREAQFRGADCWESCTFCPALSIVAHATIFYVGKPFCHHPSGSGVIISLAHS
jgi:hypothetical protein